MTNDKLLLRQLLLSNRAKLASTQVANLSALITRQLLTSSLLINAKTIALYCATRNEVDTHELALQLWSAKKLLYLPVITDFELKTMQFAAFTSFSELINNRYDIPEPTNKTSLISMVSLDAIIMPLVGFDEQLHRLGMGAGFYDRALSNIASADKKPLLTGLAYECQKVVSIPVDVHDVPLDFVVTEERIYTMPA